MQYGVLPEGFMRKRLPEVLLDLNNGAKSVFGNDLDVSPQSPDGQFHGIIANEMAELWEILEGVWHSFDIDQAEGTRLQALVAMLGQQQALTASRTRIIGTITGAPGTVIPAGSAVAETSANQSAELLSDVTIPVTGTIEAAFYATATGAVPFLKDTMTVILSPVSGWDDVTNAADGVEGTADETAADVRKRVTKAQAATSPEDRMSLALADLPGVKCSRIHVNVSDDVRNGIPARVFAPVVFGDAPDSLIAAAVWQYHPMNIASHGTTIVQHADTSGHCRSIQFSRAVEVPVHVKVDIESCGSGGGSCGCSAGSEASIKQAIVDALEAQRGCGCVGGIITVGAAYYAAVGAASPSIIHDVQLSKDGTNYTKTSLMLAWNEVAVFNVNNVHLCAFSC